MRCQQCGAELAYGAAFCGSCGADTRATSPYGHASGGDGSGGYPTGGYPSSGYGSAGYPSAGYGSGGYGPGGYPPPGQRRGSAALWVALALFAVGVASVVAWFALNRSSDEQPVAAATTPSASAAPTTASQPAPAAGGQQNATVTVTQPPPVTVTQQAPRAAAPAAPTVVETQSGLEESLPTGSWLLVLESMPKSRYSQSEAWSKASSIGSAVVIDSSRVSGLNSGYWAVIADRAFESKSAANGTCSSYGRSVGGECYPRRVGG